MHSDRQLPERNEVFLDHVGFFVDDLARAGAQLQRLGFAVSPVHLQQNADAAGTLRPSGTSNRLAPLRRGFIEVLAATHDTPLADQLRQALGRYAGLHLIAFSHADIPGQRVRLQADGFAMQPVARLRRHVAVLEGLAEVRWSVLRPQPGEMQEARAQFAYCHTPELTWVPGAPPPVNAADALTDLLLCVADPPEAAGRYGLYVGRRPQGGDGACGLRLDRGGLLFVAPAVAQRMLPAASIPAVPWLAGQALRSRDLPVTRRALAANGVTPAYADDELVCVGPQDALGAYLLFHGSEVEEPWRRLAERLNARASSAPSASA